jgi:hypothetical protein
MKASTVTPKEAKSIESSARRGGPDSEGPMATILSSRGAGAFLEENRGQLDWLLEDSDPSVRLYALTKLLGESADSPEAVAARSAVMRSSSVAEILARQTEGGYWSEGPDFYTAKYGGTVWQLLILAELGADGGDPAVRAAVEFILGHSQDRESGGFSVEASAKAGGGRHSEVIPCLTGNMAYALVALGYGEDPRVAAAIDWICSYQRADDGDSRPPSGWPYDRYEMCFGRHSCHMGVVKSLKALAAIPPKKRGKNVKAKIGELSEYVLVHHVHKKSHDLSKLSKPGWLRFGFPLMYQTDALEILCLLADLGIHDPRMAEAIEAVAARRGSDGRWKLENSFNGKTLVDIEKKGADSKWITARALHVLDRWSRAE